MRARQAKVEAFGGPDVIGWTDVDLPDPGPGEVMMVNEAVGLNYIDTYHRTGIYPIPLPSGLGMEAAGRVAAVGPGVSGFAEGDRIATFGPQIGAYATARNLPAASLFHVPDGISSDLAAAVLLKGCTVEFLAERCARVAPGDAVLVHAAAGGVGLLLVQWLKAMGATVIGTVSSEEKAASATAAGADHIVRYDREDVAARVRELTAGTGVRVTYDGVGRDTWQASLDSTGRRGLIVSYGNASAPVTGINLGVLAQKGSLYSTRPTLFDYYREPDERTAGVARVWDMLASGRLSVTIGQRYALEDAAQAHADLEARATQGSTLLVPD